MRKLTNKQYEAVKDQYKRTKSILIWTRYYEVLVRCNDAYFVLYGMCATEHGQFSFLHKGFTSAKVLGWKEIGFKDINEIMSVPDDTKHKQCRNQNKVKSK